MQGRSRPCGYPPGAWPPPVRADPVVLALDLSTRTGYACGRRFDRYPTLRVGTWMLPSVIDGSVGATLSALDLKLAQVVVDWDVEHIIFEAPFPPGEQSSTATARMLIGLPGIVEKVAHECGIDVTEGNLSSARKLVLGRGRVPWDRDLASRDPKAARKKSRLATKAASMAWAEGQGIQRIDDNGADAAIMHRYACTILASKVSA